MILIAQYCSDSPFQIRSGPLRIRGQRSFNPMCLYVDLIHEINSIPVAQLIPSGIVGIMTRSDRIEIQLLQHTDFLLHPFFRDCSSILRMMFMTVNPTHNETLFVYPQHSVLSDCNRSKTDVLAFKIHSFACLIFQCEYQRIQVRRLIRPQKNLLHIDLKKGGTRFHRKTASVIHAGLSSHRTLHSAQAPSLRVQEFHFHRSIRIAVFPVHIAPGCHLTVFQHFIRKRKYLPVSDMNLRLCIKSHRTENSGQRPVILVFQITSVAEPHHLKRNPVFSGMYQFRDFKFRRKLAVLGVSCQDSVDPEIETGFHTFKTQINTFSVPRRRQLCLRHITSRRIITGHKRRIHLSLSRFPAGTDRISFFIRPAHGIDIIGINRITVSLRLPVSGNFYVIPR